MPFVFTESRTPDVSKLDLQPAGIAIAELALTAYSVVPDRTEHALYTENSPPQSPELVFSTVLRL
jgi:hypothetical protein